jgi:uncharacterized protein
VTVPDIERALVHGKIAPDRKHSHAEDRFIAVGRDEAGRPMFVAFIIRGRDGQNLISARYMHAKEAKRYDEAANPDLSQ